MYLQAIGNIQENIDEYIKDVMDKDSYILYLEELNKNPFIKMVFVYIIPYLFQTENKKSEPEEDNIKTGIQALIEKNKKKLGEIEKKNSSFEKYIVSFIYKSEQNYDIVKNITYTYLNNIIENVAIIAEEDKKKSKNKTDSSKPMESVAKKITERGKDVK